MTQARITWTLIALAALAGCGPSGSAVDEPKGNPPLEAAAALGWTFDEPATPLQQEMMAMSPDLAPLFVLGDVNEDGVLDETDRLLIARAGELPASQVRGITCASAGDVNLDGAVDASDLAAFDTLRGEDDLYALPLTSQPYGDCSYANRLVAAPSEWSLNAPIELRLLAGHTIEDVELVPDFIGAEVQVLEDGTGWDVWLPEDFGPEELAPFILYLDGTPFIFTLSRAEDPNVAAETEETWVWAGRTDTDGDGDGDDPRDAPPPTVWGEEIDALDTCPQDGKGCEALIIDFSKAKLFEFDSDQTRHALKSVGCNVVHVAPSFTRVPKPYTIWRLTFSGFVKQTIQPSAASVARAKATNVKSWQKVRTGVATHRANVAKGRDLVYAHVNAHGSGSATYCGSWGPGFSTGAGTLRRDTFHWGNYLVARGKTCNAVAEDWSCYSGNTPKLINELNNTGLGKCVATVPDNHGFHAAFWGDLAASSAPTTETCTNGEILLRDVGTAGMIKRFGRYKDYGKLADGFRQEIVDDNTPPSGIGADGKYADRGYNQKGGTTCTSHVKKY